MALRVQEVPLRVSGDDPALAPGLHTVLDHFAFAWDSSPPARSSLHLHFSLHESPLTVPKAARRLTTSREGLHFFRKGEQLYIELKDGVVRLDPASGTAQGTLSKAAGDADRDALLFCLFFYAAVVLLYYRGLSTMHGACLARSGDGCLLLGESGSGKSTLAMNLVRQGWDYLSDDTVLLRRGQRGVDTFPLRRDFCLVGSAAKHFPEVAAHATPHLTNSQKQRIRIRALYPDQAASRCHPSVLLFPRIVDRSCSQLIPINDKTALMQLMQHSGALAVLDPPVVTQHLDLLKELLRQARSYRLLAGRNLKECPDDVIPSMAPYLSGEASLSETQTF